MTQPTADEERVESWINTNLTVWHLLAYLLQIIHI